MKIHLIIAALLYTASCTGGATDKQIKTEIVKEITVDPQATRYINRLYPNMSTFPDSDYLAISNATEPANIILVDFKGEFVERLGSQGRGPDELESARYFGISEQEQVVVYDQNQGLIKEFDTVTDTVISNEADIQGHYITSLNLSPCNGKWLAAIDKLEGSTMGVPEQETPVIAVFDDQFQNTHTLGRYDPFFIGEGPDIQQEPLFSVDCGSGVVYTTHSKVPFIQKTDAATDKLMHRTSHKPASFRLSDDFISLIEDPVSFEAFLINEQSVTSHITHTDELLLLTWFNETEEFYQSRDYREREYHIAAFDRSDYTYYGEVKIEGAVMGSTSEGYLIELVDDDPDNFTVRFLEVR